MDTIFINIENRKNSEFHVLVLKLTDKLDIRNQKRHALSILVFTKMERHEKLIR